MGRKYVIYKVDDPKCCSLLSNILDEVFNKMDDVNSLIKYELGIFDDKHNITIKRTFATYNVKLIND